MFTLKRWFEFFELDLDYRVFVANVLQSLMEENPKFSLAYFSQISGLKSRSTITDIRDGRRRINRSNIAQIQKGLMLPEECHKLFYFLVAMTEQDFEPQLNKQQITDLFIENLNKLRNQIYGNFDDVDFYKNANWPIVFTALNDKVGSSIDTIQKRTGLEKLEIRNILSGLIHLDSVYLIDKLYYLNQNFVEKHSLAKDESFKKFFLKTSHQILEKAEMDFSAMENIFLNACFTIDKNKLPELRKRMYLLLNELATQSENPHGDTVAVMNIGVYTTS